jgi:HEAT repeat protein
MNRTLLVVLASLVAPAVQAQGIAQRVARVPDGTVRMSFTARPGVCGHGRNISTSTSDEWESDCDSGPVRVALTIRGHEVIALRTYVGGRWRPTTDGVTDLGQVPAPEAADYLLSLAGKVDAEGRRDAIFPATLADSAVVWPKLIAIAKDPASPRGTRKQAVFWLGQAAGEAATRGLDSIVYQDTIDRSVREQAVFALSQRPKDEGVPVLLRVAKTHPDPAIRKKALFWLAQSGDPRAIALFEDILKK